jgi:hypothetical protein
MEQALVGIGLILVILVLFVLRKPRKNYLQSVLSMSPKQKAMLLVQATVLRLTQENNPYFTRYKDIFLNPGAFSPEVCKAAFHALLDQLVQFKKVRSAGEKRLKSMGAPPTYTEDLIQMENGIRLWMQTIGTGCNICEQENVVQLWNALQAGVPSIDEALSELKVQYELACQIMAPSSPFLNGFSEELVLKEALKIPLLPTKDPQNYVAK